MLKTHNDSGYAEARELLAMKHRPTAIFSASGPVNRGTFKAIRDSGVSIPQELSFIAFNETEWSTLVIPNITTISQQTYTIGTEAAKVLMKRITERRASSQPQGQASGRKKQQKKRKLHRIRIEPELIIRESTASV